MGSQRFPERDWKVFRELREVALERYCERVLDEVSSLVVDSEKTHHGRYLEVRRLLKTHDSEVARAFNSPKRSVAIIQLSVMVANRLFEQEELMRFSENTRRSVETLVELMTSPD